ncbi:MAG: hypothetical protein Udaeo2_32120 [Candidatus Udaeobacter sp.]|nr:MAG: hypothetical protein Udaeo2_32120 [Candidatus Udaeobacter sp.]
MISSIVWSLCMANSKTLRNSRFAIHTPKSCSGGFLTMVNLGYRPCRRERRRGRDLSRKAVPAESHRRSCSVRRIFSTMIGLCVGGVVFYFPSAYTACDWFWPKSNLCGLPAMMIAAPIGAMVRGIIGWRVGCRNSVRLPGRTRQRHSRDDHGARQESRHTRPLMRSCVFVQVD